MLVGLKRLFRTEVFKSQGGCLSGLLQLLKAGPYKAGGQGGGGAVAPARRTFFFLIDFAGLFVVAY